MRYYVGKVKLAYEGAWYAGHNGDTFRTISQMSHVSAALAIRDASVLDVGLVFHNYLVDESEAL